MVAAIDPASSAAAAGLEEGAVIQEINQKPVKSAKQLVELAQKLNGNEKVALRLWRQGRSGYVVLDPAK